MLRQAFYRRIVGLALTAAFLVGLGVCLYATFLYRNRLALERDHFVAEAENRLAIFESFLAATETKLRARGESALQELASRFDGGADLLGLDREELAAEAARLGVSEIYLIDSGGWIRATSFEPDLGLNLFALDSGLAELLRSLYASGRKASHRITSSTMTGQLNLYQYYGPVGSPYLLEVSSRLEEDQEHGGADGLKRLSALIFSRHEGLEALITDFDLVVYNERAAWSFLEPGRAASLEPELRSRAESEGQAARTEGRTLTYYKPLRLTPVEAALPDRMMAKIAFDLSPLYSFLAASLGMALLASVSAGLLALAMTRRFIDLAYLRRIEALKEGMGRVVAGDYAAEFRVEGEDELADIAAGMRRMVESILAAEERERASRTTRTVGLMAGGIAHDLNNLLSGSVGAASLLKERLREEGSIPAEELRSTLELMETAGARGNALVRDLFRLAPKDRGALPPLDLGPLLRECVELVRGSSPPEVSLELRLPREPVRVAGRAEDLERVFLNLGRNAVQAMTEMRPAEQARGGRLLVEALRDGLLPASGGRAAAPAWSIRFEDEGVGMGPEQLERLFEPFFTTKRRSAGSGLGLAVSRAIVEEHGGAIRAACREGGGCVFTVELPVLD